MRQQDQHVGRVSGNLISRRVLQPVALAATGNVRADDPNRRCGLTAQSLRQGIKVAPLTRQSVHTHDDMRTQLVTPLPVGHAVSARRIRTH